MVSYMQEPMIWPGMGHIRPADSDLSLRKGMNWEGFCSGENSTAGPYHYNGKIPDGRKSQFLSDGPNELSNINRSWLPKPP
jgi:hypothetical protein